MKQIIILLLSLLAIESFATAKKDSVGITKINGKFHLRYMVSPGETIYRISTRYKVSISDLLDLNPELEFGLKTGQIINIPYDPSVFTPQAENATVTYPKTAPANPTNTDTLTDKGVVHIVQAGETYYSLAKKYNLTTEELLRINKVELKQGQKVIINDKIKAPAQVSKSANTPTVTDKAAQPPLVVATPTSKPANLVTPAEESVEDQKTLEPISYDNVKKHLLVIPFDPYLYFSDADDEIASVSKMQRIKVRQAFRRRLNALLEPAGYETIHLLGGKAKDSITDLNKIYSSVGYSYQDILNAPANVRLDKQPDKMGGKDKRDNQPVNIGDNSRGAQAKDAKKFFGVKVSNLQFFTYFNNKYKIDYYLFINQFEVKTNYENCLDRATLNYERGFTIHYSIFDKEGKQIAGNRLYIDYNSNTNQISKILADNMQKAADKIISDLPPAQ